LQIGNAIPGASGSLYAGFSSSNTGNDRVAHFNGENGNSRYEFTLSNSGQGGQWYQNFLSFIIEGGTSQNYYLKNTPGKTSDANWAKIIGQGATSYHKGLIIGEYYNVPISIGANNKAILYLKGDTSAYAQIVNADLKLLTDNKKIIIGTGSDATITYDGTNMVFDSSAVGTGLAYFSDNVSSTGFITRTYTTETTDKKAYELVKYSSENFYKNGIKNYSAWGECYSPFKIRDMTRPVYNDIIYEKCNPTTLICENITEVEIIYPYETIEDGLNLDCQNTMIAKADNYERQTIKITETETDGIITEFNNSILAEHFITNTTKDPATLLKIENFYNNLKLKTYQEMKDLVLTDEGKLSEDVLFDYEKSKIGSYNLEAIGHTNRAMEVLMLWKISKIEEIQNQQLDCWDLMTQQEIVNCMRNIN